MAPNSEGMPESHAPEEEEMHLYLTPMQRASGDTCGKDGVPHRASHRSSEWQARQDREHERERMFERDRERQFQERMRAFEERAQQQEKEREEREREREQQLRLEARERERQMRLEMQQEMDRLRATLVAQGSSGSLRLALPGGQLPASFAGQLPALPGAQSLVQPAGHLPSARAAAGRMIIDDVVRGQAGSGAPMNEDELLEDREPLAPATSDAQHAACPSTNKRRLLIIDSDDDEPSSDQEEDDEDDFSVKLEEFGNTLVSPYGTAVPVQSVCPFNVNDLGNLLCKPGSHVVKAPVQSGKSVAIATMCYASHLLGKPTIIIVGDVKKHVKGCDGLVGKLNVVLNEFGCHAQYVEPGTEIRITEHDSFLNGKMVLVAQFHHHHLGKLRNVLDDIKKIQKIDEISDATVILDEGDVMWWRTPESPDRTQREFLLYQVVDQSVAGNLVHVSATHFATVGWHSMGADAIAYDVLIADRVRLAESGYTLNDDLTPVVVDGQPVYLPLDVFGTQKNAFLSECSEVLAFMNQFDQDDRDYRFMQVALTSLIDGGSNSEHTTVTLAKDLASKCTRSAARGRPVVVLIACSGPVRMFVKGKDVSGLFSKEAKSSIPAAIHFVDELYGSATKLILAGYACVLRGVSLCSSARVITHVLLAPSKTMSSADLEQAACRACGKNRSTRAANNRDPTGQHPHYKPSDVVVLMRQKDLELVKSLPQMTEDALRACGTGKEADVNNWHSMQFPPEVDPALLCGRPPANGALGKRVDRGLAPAKATARRRRTEAEKQAKRQRTAAAAHATQDEQLQLQVLRVLAAAPNKRLLRTQLTAALAPHIVAGLRRQSLPEMRDAGWLQYAGNNWSITAAGLAKVAAAGGAPAAATAATAPAATAAVRAAAAAAAATAAAAAQQQPANIPQGSSQQQVLLILASALPEHMTAADIQAAMPGTITDTRLATTLDRMVADGLVQRPSRRTGGWSLTKTGELAAAPQRPAGQDEAAATEAEEEEKEEEEEEGQGDGTAAGQQEAKGKGHNKSVHMMKDVLGGGPTVARVSILFTLRILGKCSRSQFLDFSQRMVPGSLESGIEHFKQGQLARGTPAFKAAAAALLDVENEAQVKAIVEQGPAHTRWLMLGMIHHTRQLVGGQQTRLYKLPDTNLATRTGDWGQYMYEITALGVESLKSSLRIMSA